MARRLAWMIASILASTAGAAHATGVCDNNPPASIAACTSAVQSGGTVVNDIFRDAHGPSNKVVVFATNDHGPQPCESLEYTIYLTDHPESRDVVTQPLVTGVDPTKWNRAVLTTVFTQGWIQYRAPDPVGRAACGDLP